MPSWSLQFEGEVFDGVEVIPTSHVYVQDKVLDPDPWVCHSAVCLYVYKFKALWEFMVQYFISKAQGVSTPSVSGRDVACRRLLLCSVFIPNWCLVVIIALTTIVRRLGVPFRSVDGPSCASFLLEVLT